MTHFLTLLNELGDVLESSWQDTLDVTQVYMNLFNATGLLVPEEALHDFRPNLHGKSSNDYFI